MATQYRVRTLQPGELVLLNGINLGYEASYGYQVQIQVDAHRYQLALVRQDFAEPWAIDYDWDWELDESIVSHLDQGLVLVAEVGGGDLVGMIEGGIADNDLLKIYSLYVDGSQRRRGIGQALVQALEQVAKERQVRGLGLDTQVANGPAIDFYRSLGFEVVGVHAKYYSDFDVAHGETAVFLYKWI